MEPNKKFMDDEDVIDLGELFRVLLRRWWLILLFMCIGGGIAGASTRYLMTPVYRTSSSLYILTKTTSVTSLADLQIGTQLTNDFQVIAVSRPVVEDAIQAIAQEKGVTYTYDEYREYVTISNENNTRILTISVTHPDPEMACAMANALAESTADHMAQIMDTDRPTTVESAIVPKKPVGPSLKKNTVIGAMAGAVLIGGLLIILYLLDDTIKTEEDVLKYLGIDTIGVFPMDEVIEKESRARHKKKKKHKKRKK